MNKGKGKAKVLFVVTSCTVKGNTGLPTGFNLAEVTHPLAKLEEKGIVVEIASIKGGKAQTDGLEDIKDPVIAKYLGDEDFRRSLENTIKLDDVKSTDYDAIFFAGGHGTMWDFPESPAVLKSVPQFYEAGKIVSAVCHGPAALVNVKLSNGSYLITNKEVAGFTNGEEEAVQSTNVVPFLLESVIVKRGAKYKHSPIWSNNIAIDGKLITGQNPQSASSVGVAIAKALLNSEEKESTAGAVDFVSGVSPTLSKYTVDTLTNEVWSRPGLSMHDRCIVTVSCLIARDQSIAFSHYFNKALDNGVTPGELSEIITHLGFYSGWPNAVAAVESINRIFTERGIVQVQLPSIDPLKLDKSEVLPGDDYRQGFINSNIAPISPGFAKYTNELLYGQVWLRAGLASKSRSLATICAMIASGDTQFLNLYMGRGIQHGITKEEMSEVLTQLSFYAGWPKIVSATLIVKEAYEAAKK